MMSAKLATPLEKIGNSSISIREVIITLIL